MANLCSTRAKLKRSKESFGAICLALRKRGRSILIMHTVKKQQQNFFILMANMQRRQKVGFAGSGWLGDVVTQLHLAGTPAQSHRGPPHTTPL